MRAENGNNKRGFIFSWDIEVFVVIVFGVLALVAGFVITHFDTEAHTTDKTCQEDEACWNCKTMGNHICGSLIPPMTAERKQAHK